MNAFDCSVDYILENEIALLRPLQPDDAQHLLRFSLYEPDIWQFSISQPIGVNGLRNYIYDAMEARKTGEEYPFIVFDKRVGLYAGSSRFYDIQRKHNTIQLGYTWYGKEFQGTGLNKNCKFLLLEFAFDTLGFDRLEFQADKNNARSIAAMKSIGCLEEGTLRSHLLRPDGSRRDSIVLGILRGEWQNRVKEELQQKIQSINKPL